MPGFQFERKAVNSWNIDFLFQSGACNKRGGWLVRRASQVSVDYSKASCSLSNSSYSWSWDLVILTVEVEYNVAIYCSLHLSGHVHNALPCFHRVGCCDIFKLFIYLKPKDIYYNIHREKQQILTFEKLQPLNVCIFGR